MLSKRQPAADEVHGVDDGGLDRRALLSGAATGVTALLLNTSTHAAVGQPPGQAVKLTPVTPSGYSGSAAAVADTFFFPGWEHRTFQTKGVIVEGKHAAGCTINAVIGGKGPPLLLLHGNPETHVAWHKVAGRLAEQFTVVATDLRGYGDSGKPDGGVDHVDYAKVAMGADQLQVMGQLGFERFVAMGHDRGARVLQQMMLDAPSRVTRGVLLDIATTDAMYEHTTAEFATKYFWWFLQIQDAPFPETLMNAATYEYLRYHLQVQNKTPGALTGEAWNEYLRCYSDPGTTHAVCEDYRAAATIDKTVTTSSGNPKVTQPLQVLWGSEGTVGQLFDVLGLWREAAVQVSGQALQCGHLVAEEVPEQLLAATLPFLKA